MSVNGWNSFESDLRIRFETNASICALQPPAQVTLRYSNPLKCISLRVLPTTYVIHSHGWLL